MTDIAIEKLYVDKDGMVTFICKKCGESRRESVVQYKNQTGTIKVECKCANVCEVQLEFRKTFRKETFLDGLYYRSSHQGDWGKMIGRDLSLEGVQVRNAEGALVKKRRRNKTRICT